MREKLKAILGKHKVIGDTTYGLGYAEAEQLTTEIIYTLLEAFKKDVGEMISGIEIYQTHSGQFSEGVLSFREKTLSLLKDYNLEK